MCSIKKIGIYSLFLSPLIVLIIFWYIFSIDIPWNDDVMVLAFTRNWAIRGFDFWIIKQLFAHYNEHIIVITKLFFWLNFKLSGYVNLSYLVLQGMMLYIAFILLFIKYTSSRGVYLKLMTVFMLANLTYDEGYLWAMSSIQNFASLLFTFVAIIYMAKSKISYSFLFLCLGLLSSAQTLVFIPVWVLGVQYRGKITWKIVGLILAVLTFYFSGYQKTGIQPDMNSILVSFDKERIISILTFFTPPFGSIGKTFTLIYFCFECLLLLIVYCRIIIDFKSQQFTERKIIIASLLIWSSLIMLMTVIVRVEIESRYLIYPILKTTCIYLYLNEMSPSVKLNKVMFTMSIFFYLSSFFPSIVKAKNTHLAMAILKFNLLKNQATFYYGTDDVDSRKVNPYVSELNATKLVEIPNRLNGRIFSHLLLFNQISNEQIKSVKFTREQSSSISQSLSKSNLIVKNIQVDSMSPFIVYQKALRTKNWFETNFILLKSRNKSLLFNFKCNVPSIIQFAQDPQYINQLIIYKNMVPYGQYDMYLLGNSNEFHDLNNFR
ncbi:hypothetical protein [Aquirufa aurantiipilula]